MKEGWKTCKIGDIFNTGSGGTPSKNKNEYYEGGNIPWLRSGEVAQGLIYESELFITEEGLKNSSAKLFPKDTVVIAMYGATVGQVGVLKKEMTTNQAICGLFPNPNYSPVFVMYFLRSMREEYLKEAAGGAQPNISQAVIRNTDIPLIPLSEQQQIVEELDLLSGIIEKKKEQLRELDNLAQSIFYEMFGDPVANEKGFPTSTVGENVTDVKYGTSRPACENGKFKYLRMGNLTLNGHLDLTDLKLIDIPDNEIEKCIVRRGDILFNRTNSLELIGKTCMFDLDEPMVIAGYIIRVRFNEFVNPRFISVLFNMPEYKKLLKGMAKGAVNQANINSKELQSIRIILPPLSLQQSFASKIEAIEKEKALIKQSITETETLFNSRMDYYFG